MMRARTVAKGVDSARASSSNIGPDSRAVADV